MTVLSLALAVGGGCRRSAATEQHTDGETPRGLALASLTDQESLAVTLSDFRGKTLVLSFFFASCGSVCPRETRALSEVQRRLPPALQARVQFMSLSVDPEHDTPEALKQFALSNGADLGNWAFVRADERTTRALTKEFGVFDGRVGGPSAPSGHVTAAYLLDAEGHVMQRYAGSPLDVPRLAREIERLDAWFRKQKET